MAVRTGQPTCGFLSRQFFHLFFHKAFQFSQSIGKRPISGDQSKQGRVMPFARAHYTTQQRKITQFQFRYSNLASLFVDVLFRQIIQCLNQVLCIQSGQHFGVGALTQVIVFTGFCHLPCRLVSRQKRERIGSVGEFSKGGIATTRHVYVCLRVCMGVCTVPDSYSLFFSFSSAFRLVIHKYLERLSFFFDPGARSEDI